MSDANFEKALDFVLRFEGGYVDHPADPGGATNMGITRATLGSWRGRAVSKQDVRALKRTEAAMIYKAQYWNAAHCAELPPGVDVAVFDLAVNSGVSRAIRLLQRALRVTEDAHFGPKTAAACRTMAASMLVRKLCTERRVFLQQLSTFPVFGRGWLARVTALEALALAMTGASKSPSFAQQQEKLMDDNKSILASRTLWANTIGLLALGGSALGFNTSTLDVAALTDSLFQVIAAGSFIVSSVFRVVATQRLS